MAEPVLAVRFALAVEPVALALAEPEFAPLAPSTTSTVPLAVLLPAWPVAVAGPLVFRTRPSPVTVSVLATVADAELSPPVLAPPLLTETDVESDSVLKAAPIPLPEAPALEPTPESELASDTAWVFVGEAFPLEALPEAVVGPAFA